jgi:hypothetical protein
VVQGQQIEPEIKGGARKRVDRQASEVGPGRRVGHEHRSDRVVDGLGQVAEGQGDAVTRGHRAQGGADVQRVAGSTSSSALLLDPGHHVGVQPKARGEREPSLVGTAEPDAALAAFAKQLEQVPGCLDAVVGHAYRPREHVRTAAGDDAEQGSGGAGSAREQPIDYLVDRPVATEHEHHVVLGIGRVECELGRVTASLGLGHFEVDLGGERLRQDVTSSGASSGCLGVHDESGPLHERHPTPADTLRQVSRSEPASGADEPEIESGRLDIQVRVLAALVVLEALAMALFVVIDVVAALREADAEWGAVWFVLVVMGLWATGLVVVARGVLLGRRWAFTPILFTQLLFGIASLSFFGAADTVARVVWGVVLVYVIVVMRVLFSRPVREHLVYANT